MQHRFRTAITLLACAAGLSFSTYANTSVFRGRVLDQETHQPIPGATVRAISNQGADTLGTVTDSTGSYVLSLDTTPQTMQFSHISYAPFATDHLDTLVLLNPEQTELSGVVVSGDQFQDLPQVNTRHDLQLDQRLRYVLSDEVEFDLNDLTTIIKEAPSINKPQADFSATLHIQGYRAPTFIDGIEQISDEKLQVLGKTSVYTFDRVTVEEDHAMAGGFPGSVMVQSKQRPSKEQTVIYLNPIIREAYHELRLGDSAFAFVDVFHADNTLLQLLTNDLKAPTFVGAEAKAQYWQRQHAVSLYYLMGKGDVNPSTNKGDITAQTLDQSLLFSFSTQPGRLGGLSHPLIQIKAAHQDSRLSLANGLNSIDLALHRNRNDLRGELKIFTGKGAFLLHAALQQDRVALEGRLEATEVGDGGAAFSQSLDSLLVGQHDLGYTLGLGWEVEHLDLQASLAKKQGRLLWAYWGNLRHAWHGVPFQIGGGYVEQVQTNMDVLDNRFVITSPASLPTQQVWYIMGKAVHRISQDWRIEANAYSNWSRMNSYQEPTWGQTLAYNEPITDTAGFIDSLLADPSSLVPYGTFHSLKGGRQGMAVLLGGKVSSAEFKAVIRYEDAYVSVPDWDVLLANQDSVVIQDYQGTKVPHLNSNGWSGFFETRIPLQELAALPLELMVQVHAEQGRPYQPVQLLPVQVEDSSGAVYPLVYGDDRVYVKQDLRGMRDRYPPSWDLDARLTAQIKPNLRAALFVNNLLDHRVILETHYSTKYLYLSNGHQWQNTSGQRLIGAMVEWRP